MRYQIGWDNIMNEENKKFLNSEDFYSRIIKALEYKGITMDELHDKICNEVGYSISKNNLYLYIQRAPSVYFLIALSKALGVSTDYLLGLENSNYFVDGFDYHYDDKKYKKFIGEYIFYFLPTVSNSPNGIVSAKLTIKKENNYSVFLCVNTDEGDKKEYLGKLILSSDYDIGYIILKGNTIGEMVFMTFFDPKINGSVVKVQNILGSMISISSGDFKRAPVMSRFLLSKEKINEDDKCFIESQLLLNSKYIYITDTNLNNSLKNLNIDVKQCNEITNRLVAAFEKKSVYSIEESYILNTLKNDFNLTPKQVENIIAYLRLSSIYNANVKINKNADSRIFMYIKNK